MNVMQAASETWFTCEADILRRAIGKEQDAIGAQKKNCMGPFQRV